MGFWFGTADIDARFDRIDNRLGEIVASLRTVVANIKDWGVSWRDRAIAAENVAQAEKLRADNAYAALDQAIADDAVTDQEQIAAAVAAATADDQQAVEQAWSELQALDAPAPEPPADPYGETFDDDGINDAGGTVADVPANPEAEINP